MKSFEEIKKEAESLYEAMDDKERAYFLFGDGSWHLQGNERLNIPRFAMHDGPSGLRLAFEDDGDSRYKDGKATCFPSPSLIACSFDPELETRYAKALASEAKEANTDMVLGPGVNIKRNPLCGRNFEYLSEDPILAGIMASSFIKALQNEGVSSCLKHFACNSQEKYRYNCSSEIDKRALNEIYLRQFEIAIKDSKPDAIMCSYNKINGVYASDNSFLLTKKLRDDWNYQGLVMSDWGAINDPIRSHRSGLDLEMPGFNDRSKDFLKALKEKRIDRESFKRSAINSIALCLKKKYRKSDKDSSFSFEKGYKVAKEIAQESFVLLKNEEDILPLDSFNDCCLIGSLAKNIRYQGSGSSRVKPAIIKSFTELHPDIPFEEGYSLSKNALSDEKHKQAIELAKNSKKCLLFLGLPDAFECEGLDRETMSLPLEQLTLAKEITKANSNVIVILSLGAPVELPFIDNIKGLLLTYLGGEAFADALNETLLGKVNPSGKLAESWPVSYKDVPFYDEYPGNRFYSLYKESIFVGYRYYQKAGVKPLFPFGFGLSYTKFRYSSLKVIEKEKKVDISLNVSNIGKVYGKEVVQVYVSKKDSKTYRPLRELKGFAKVALEPHEEKEIVISIPKDYLKIYDVKQDCFLLENGEYVFEVASSSEKIRLSEILYIKSDDRLSPKDESLLSYFGFSKSTPLNPSNEEFERLLEKKITRPSKIKPYSFDSLLLDLQKTLIGKIMLKAAKGRLEEGFKVEEDDSKTDEMLLTTSLRMMFNNGVKDKTALCILALANKRPLKAIYNLLFGRRK